MAKAVAVVALLLALAWSTCAAGEGAGEAIRAAVHGVLGDYDSELRRPDGRVDVDGMVAKLEQAGVNTYFWLIWHAATDWDDLRLFLPKAAKARIKVWVYLVPPSESPPRAAWHSEPFRLDYVRWGEEIARLSLRHPNLTAWVIDDFYANHHFYTPKYIRQMQERAKRINPRLAFLPLMYYREITRRFVREYRETIDGVVVAYPQGKDDIERAWALLNGRPFVEPAGLGHPWDRPSKPGDLAMASQTAAVLPAERMLVRFEERDDFTGPTAGYHFKQLLLDGAVVWERDVAGGGRGWRKVEVDVTKQAKGKRAVTLAFRLFDRKGVSNFGVRWALRSLRAEGLRPAAGLGEPAKWTVSRRGAFESGFGPAVEAKADTGRFHVPLIVMTAGVASQFRKRHGEPASPKRIAAWLDMCLELWRAGKCDGVVTYCLDKRPQSKTFPLASKLFREFAKPR